MQYRPSIHRLSEVSSHVAIVHVCVQESNVRKETISHVKLPLNTLNLLWLASISLGNYSTWIIHNRRYALTPLHIKRLPNERKLWMWSGWPISIDPSTNSFISITAFGKCIMIDMSTNYEASPKYGTVSNTGTSGSILNKPSMIFCWYYTVVEDL